MRTVVGVDIGSSSIKVVLFAPETNEVLHIDRQPLRSRITSTWFEEDPNIIRDQAFRSIGSVSSLAKASGHMIEAIAFTGQMHGGLVVGSDLQPLTFFITWQDKRGDEIHKNGRSYAEELREWLPEDPTGVSIHTGFLFTSLYWLIQNGGLPQKAANVLGIYDWLASLLIGRPVTDISSAAAWAMFDPVERRWREELIARAAIPSALLPEVAEPGEDIGQISADVAAELGLPLTVRVHASTGDTQASYLGADCTSNEVLFNFGTGSQSMWETNDPIATAGTDLRYLRNGKYLVTAPTLAGGEALRILADFFRDVIREVGEKEVAVVDILNKIDRLAANYDSATLKVDPIFAGSKFRLDGERGSIQGITGANLRAATLSRALLEGMIEEIARPYFQREGEVRHERLVLAGNVMRKSAALRQIAALRFGLPVRMAPFEEDAAVGAAKLCLR